MSERLELVISGQVQGVFFRASTQEEAQRLGITGWVRNHTDGTVRVLAEGPRDQLEALLRWCHHGPQQASVALAEPTWGAATGEFSNFSVEH